jgi:hypothetical protein
LFCLSLEVPSAKKKNVKKLDIASSIKKIKPELLKVVREWNSSYLKLPCPKQAIDILTKMCVPDANSQIDIEREKLKLGLMLCCVQVGAHALASNQSTLLLDTYLPYITV